jgi:hypothetical protein
MVRPTDRLTQFLPWLAAGSIRLFTFDADDDVEEVKLDKEASNGQTHWNGSTADPNAIKTDNIPIEIRRALPVIVGDVNCVAIESGITRAYEGPGLVAMGFFVIHVGGRLYGVRSSEATMLANSFDEVSRRVSRRGRHTAPFVDETPANIASAVTIAIYSDSREDETFLGRPAPELANAVYANNLLWAPDGDEAFDDGSYVLQFDVEDRVRVIAFNRSAGYAIDLASVRDVWLEVDAFYGILQEWREEFMKEWRSLPKCR